MEIESIKRIFHWETVCLGIEDPVYSFISQVKICGSMEYAISNVSEKILKPAECDESKAIGQKNDSKIIKIVKENVRNCFVNLINVGKVSCFDLDKGMTDICTILSEKIEEELNLQGIRMNSFIIDDVLILEKE